MKLVISHVTVFSKNITQEIQLKTHGFIAEIKLLRNTTSKEYQSKSNVQFKFKKKDKLISETLK